MPCYSIEYFSNSLKGIIVIMPLISTSVCFTYLVECSISCNHGDCYGDRCDCHYGWEGDNCSEGDTLAQIDLS